MTSIHTHICLVSEQPMPNLLPVLCSAAPPTRVWLLVSPEMKESGRTDGLCTILKERGIQVHIREVNAHHMESVRTAVELLVKAFGHEGVALNVTGGTKPMALAAYEVCQKYEMPILYLDTQNDKLLNLTTGEAESLPHTCSLVDYLTAYGYTRVDQRNTLPAAEWMEVANELAQRTPEWAGELKKVYKFLNKESNTEPFDLNETRRAIIDCMQRGGLCSLEMEGEKGRLCIHSKEARTFATGGWLEAYTLAQVRMIEGVRDAYANVKLRGHEGSGNEADVLFMYRNQLHILECKSGAPDEPATYKLNDLRVRVGGTFGKGMLVAYRPSEMDKLRCKESPLNLVGTSEMPRLKEVVEEWLTKTR